MHRTSLAALLAFTLVACGGSSPGGGEDADLDTKNTFWTTKRGNDTLVLFTYARSSTVMLGVRDTLKSNSAPQYQGSRKGTAAGGYELDLHCSPPGLEVCSRVGAQMLLTCTASTKQLRCGDLLFDETTASEITE